MRQNGSSAASCLWQRIAKPSNPHSPWLVPLKHTDYTILSTCTMQHSMSMLCIHNTQCGTRPSSPSSPWLVAAGTYMPTSSFAINHTDYTTGICTPCNPVRMHVCIRTGYMTHCVQRGQLIPTHRGSLLLVVVVQAHEELLEQYSGHVVSAAASPQGGGKSPAW